ncbi:MAG: hypothetical protein H7288_21220 [Kineosporiaceae bacterium]|nr:hypothetical protein [Aeromicrobium sp.]
MSTSDMACPKKKRRPLRKLIFLSVLTGGVVAIKNALKDKGGSYEAPAQPFATSVPTPPVPPAPPVRVVTAEDIIERRPVENLDEFADPVEPAVAAADPKEADPSEVDPAIDEAVANAPDPDDLKETPGKIDPFGIR